MAFCTPGSSRRWGDSACGYAALSLMPPRTGVLSVEYKVNLLVPARGSHFLARGRVLRAGHTILVCAGGVFALQDGEETIVATMPATMIVIRDREGVLD
jgi:acyl-coenzyme A thioesterase PaaI-like protein